MATNIGNPAFRMALRGLLVHEFLGAVPQTPSGSVAGGDTYLCRRTRQKNTQFF